VSSAEWHSNRGNRYESNDIRADIDSPLKITLLMAAWCTERSFHDPPAVVLYRHVNYTSGGSLRVPFAPGFMAERKPGERSMIARCCYCTAITQVRIVSTLASPATFSINLRFLRSTYTRSTHALEMQRGTQRRTNKYPYNKDHCCDIDAILLQCNNNGLCCMGRENYVLISR